MVWHAVSVSVQAKTGVGVGSWIERRARIDPDRPAIITGDHPVTYAELAERIRRLAGGLGRLGVVRGDRVVWLGPNHGAFLEAFFAVGKLGAVLAPVNHRLAPNERALVLEDAEPKVLIEHHAVLPTRAPASVRHRLVVGGAARDGAVDYEAFLAGSPEHDLEIGIDLDDLLFLPHTSGTTGSPKGVMLSHGNVTWNVVNFLSRADFRGDDVTIAIAPFFRVGGTGVNVLPVLFLGGTVVVPDDVTGDGLLGLVERHRVTVGFGNPDVLDALVRAERWRAADLSSVRFILTGGAPVPERLIRAYHDRGIALVQGYGLSEAGPWSCSSMPSAPSGRSGRPVDRHCSSTSGSSISTARRRSRPDRRAAGTWPERHGRLLAPTSRDRGGAGCGWLAAHR